MKIVLSGKAAYDHDVSSWMSYSGGGAEPSLIDYEDDDNPLAPKRTVTIEVAPTHYVHCNDGNALFVKVADFFVSQGGLTEPWGKAWKPVVATSIGHARRQAAKIFQVELSSIHDGEV